jgi:hypothetical protein
MFSQCLVFIVLLEQKLANFFQLKKLKKKNKKKKKKTWTVELANRFFSTRYSFTGLIYVCSIVEWCPLPIPFHLNQLLVFFFAPNQVKR